MTVRRSTDDDWPAILDVHRRAFGGEVEPRMADAVRRSDGWVPELSLVAELDGVVAGHVLTSWVGLEGSTRRLLQTGPIGVLPEHQGRGLGSALMRATLDGARGLGEPLVLLEGDPAFYRRFGFVRADEHGLVPPRRCTTGRSRSRCWTTRRRSRAGASSTRRPSPVRSRPRLSRRARRARACAHRPGRGATRRRSPGGARPRPAPAARDMS